ncbi:hypothetical protein [Polaribacter sargassicola]|uniref:hypothetical protein n=1 Tax=Polaribacter sargassicola TaxID=2836891 RepID=UPI001F2CAE03|nr:hypothetical protein [Polaribacter sp. DS7-9]MCG1036315.1 hypothetical protein [Polaribacter sp. DS7-9]
MENKIKNSEEYLNSKLGKKNSFSIPKNYFDTIDDVIDLKITEEKLPKENSFKVPDNYFKNLEDNILSKVTEKKEPKVITLKTRLFKVIPFAAAASVILFIGLNSFIFNKTDDFTLDSLSEQEIENWLEYNPMNSNDIALVLQEDILSEDDFSFSSIKDETIEDYINSIDNYSLFEELDEN